jgi:trigger factor
METRSPTAPVNDMPVKTTITELPDSRVRLDAEVPSEEIESSLQRTAAAMGRELRIPGFRKGKVPGPMVLQRVGREAVLEQAVRESLPEWYEQAILQADLKTIGDPKLDLQELPTAGQALNFSIEISVTPKAKLGTYKGLEVGKPDPEVPEALIDQEIERLREGFARVETVDRAIAEGDYAVVDFTGTIDGEPFQGGEARDYMLEIGGGRLIEGFEEQLIGAGAGETRTVKVDFPADYHAEELQGKPAQFEVEIKDVKEKELPPLDDDFASDASEFDTLQELRDDIGHKLEHAQEHEIEDTFRESAVDAAVAEAEIDLPDELVLARAEEMWSRTEQALERAGRDPEAFLKTAGKTREELIEEAKPDAEKQLARESVLEAVAEAEQIDVSDDEVLDVLKRTAERGGEKPEKLLTKLKRSGRDVPLRHDLRLRKAVDFLAEHASPIEMEKAKAREKLWTPDKEKEPGSPGLWTPEQGAPDRR